MTLPVLNTDDQGRELPFIWLGPKGIRLVQAPIGWYGIFAATAAVTIMLASNLVGASLMLLPAVIGCLAFSAWFTRRVGQALNPRRPLAYWFTIIRAEANTPRNPTRK